LYSLDQTSIAGPSADQVSVSSPESINTTIVTAITSSSVVTRQQMDAAATTTTLAVSVGSSGSVFYTPVGTVAGVREHGNIDQHHLILQQVSSKLWSLTSNFSDSLREINMLKDFVDNALNLPTMSSTLPTSGT